MVFNAHNELALRMGIPDVPRETKELPFILSIEMDNLVNENRNPQLAINFMMSVKSKLYCPTATVLDMAGKVNIDKVDDYHFLSRIPDGQAVTFLLGKHLFIRFVKEEGQILCLPARLSYENSSEISVDCGLVHINTVSGAIGRINERWKDQIPLLLRLLIFIYLTETETKVLSPNETVGTKSTGKYRNDFRLPITIINSNWNKWVVRTTGFNVSGHFRLQRCGENRQDVKLVFVKPFRKHGYIRAPRKENAVASNLLNA